MLKQTNKHTFPTGTHLSARIFPSRQQFICIKVGCFCFHYFPIGLGNKTCCSVALDFLGDLMLLQLLGEVMLYMQHFAVF